MDLFRGIQEYIALDANNITLVFDSGNIVNISGNIFLYPPQGHPILYNSSGSVIVIAKLLISISTLNRLTYQQNRIYTNEIHLPIDMCVWNTATLFIMNHFSL